ncbi:MAG: RNA methyltransferase [Deltaproteobacteria bacterium]|nr:RNA methyltransferase [Deltaproteobacteria bacterium]MBW2153410.1 RNA methyltransferase [Deltaproteobacteria bacterium]
MSVSLNLDNIAVVLHRPRYPENIGAAARVIRNMGIGKLIVVQPENCDLTRILKMATHAATEIVEEMEVFDSLNSALSSFQYIVGTTARMGRQRQDVMEPSELGKRLGPVSCENRIALLFGPEDRGLTNEEIRLCHSLVTIPTAEFSSLNLAQAVMIICYEIFLARRLRQTESSPRLASRCELEGMYEQLKEILIRIDFINPQNPDYWMNNMRRFFNRLPLRAKEVRIIRGICRQIDWYAKKCYRDGKENKKPDWA